MDTTEARDKAALLRAPDIYRQTERGINYSERERRGGGYIHWSGGGVREGRKQQLWNGQDCFRERALHWQKSGKHFASLALFWEQPHPGYILATCAWPPNITVRTWYPIKEVKSCTQESVHPNYKTSTQAVTDAFDFMCFGFETFATACAVLLLVLKTGLENEFYKIQKLIFFFYLTLFQLPAQHTGLVWSFY